MKLKPFGTFLVLKPLRAPEMLGGLVIAQSQKDKIMQRPLGEVIEVGPDVNTLRGDSPIEEGHVLVYPINRSAYVHGLDGEVYLFVQAEHIIAKVDRDEQATPQKAAKIQQEFKEREREAEDAARSANAAAALTDAAGLPLNGIGMPRLVE